MSNSIDFSDKTKVYTIQTGGNYLGGLTEFDIDEEKGIGQEVGDPMNYYYQGTVTQESENCYWGFFEIVQGTYVLGNYGSGSILSYTSGFTSSTNSIGMHLQSQNYAIAGHGDQEIKFTYLHGNDTETMTVPACNITVSYDDTSGKYALYVKNEAVSGYLMPSDGYFAILSESSASDASVWDINVVDGVTLNVPSLNASYSSIEDSQPTITPTNSPTPYPATPIETDEQLVPYFLANDPTLTDLQQKIQSSPYYVMKQFTQYTLQDEHTNSAKVGDATIGLSYTWGISESNSKTFSSTFGISVGFSEEIDAGSEFGGTKTTFSTNVSMSFGYSQTQSESTTTTNTESITHTIPPGHKVALYAQNNTYSLFQYNNASAVAEPQGLGVVKNGSTISVSCSVPTT